MHEQGWGTDKSERLARKFYERSCSLEHANGYVDGCTDLGIALSASRSADEKSRGADLLKRSCASGSAKACDWLQLEGTGAR